MEDESDLVPSYDRTAAAWLTLAIPEFKGRVGDLASRQFPSYVRLFHRPDQGLPSRDRSETWAALAHDHGTTFHPTAQYASITQVLNGHRGLAVPGPLTGSLDRLTLPRLRDHLANHTTTAETCWFAVWSGFSNFTDRWDDGSIIVLPWGSYWLFEGALSDVVNLSMNLDTPGSGDARPACGRDYSLPVHSPTLWWPQDRAWVVHSMYTYDSTVVGGSIGLVQELVRDPDLEALPIGPEEPLYADSDWVNRS